MKRAEAQAKGGQEVSNGLLQPPSRRLKERGTTISLLFCLFILISRNLNINFFA
jgi:hypothetical protein